MAVVFSMFDDLETYCDLIYSQTGRKPSGLCGAALYISALSHGYKFSKSDIVSPAYHIDVCNLLHYILGKVPSGISVVCKLMHCMLDIKDSLHKKLMH